MKPGSEALRELYERQRLSSDAIAARCGVSRTTVKRWLSKYDIPRRPSGRGLANRGQERPDRDTLERLVHTEHHTLRAIGAMFGVDMAAVRVWLKKDGITPPAAWVTHRKGWVPALPDAAELRRLYVDEGVSISEIARRCSVSSRPIADLLNKYGVSLRHDSGWSGGWRFRCTDGHQVRSLYEQRADNWLHENGIDHTYEPVLPFDRRCHADFLANGWYVEIWGVTNTPAYTARRMRKVNGYRLQGLPLIELLHHDFKGKARGRWKRKLARCSHVSGPPLLVLAQ